MKTSFSGVLKNKEFLKIWLAQLFSVVTANMLNFILIGRVFEATGSAIAIGFLWFFYVFPTAFLGPLSGVFLDYFDKKKILFFSSFIQAFVVLLYLGVGDNVWLIYSIILLYSFCDEFFVPAQAVLIPSLVKKKQLAAANSLFLFTTNGSIVLGFLTGGLMLKFLGYSKVLFLTISGILLLSAALSALLKWQEPEGKKKLEITLSGFYKELVEGYRFIRSEPKILFPMILLTGLQIIVGMGLIILPAISKSILSIEFADSSYFVLVPTVLGAVFGSLLVERLIRKHLKRVLIINGLFLLGASILLMGTIVSFLWFPVIFGALFGFLMGVAYVLMFIPLQVLVQENTPFRVRGRVFGTLNTLITIAAAVPVFGTVTLVDILGVKMTMTLLGTGIILLAFYARGGKYGILPNHHRA